MQSGERMEIKTYGGQIGNRTHITCVQSGAVKIGAVLGLAGARNENRRWREVDGKEYFGNYSEGDWRDFVADVEANGITNPICVVVEPDCLPVIYEGNHRVQAAIQLKLTHIPAAIRYYGATECASLLDGSTLEASPRRLTARWVP